MTGEALKTCPFCEGVCDPTGWLGGDGRRGPECEGCGATADSVEAWNRRASPPAPAEVEPVAWCAFAENGNIRLWSDDHARQVRASGYFLDMQPLYAAASLSAAVAQARREAFKQTWEAIHAHLPAIPVALADVLRALSDAAPAEEGWRPTHQHVKRGSTYRVIGEAEAQVSTTGTNDFPAPARWMVDGDTLTVYQGEDGKLWARFADEFNDGRFVAIPAPPAGGRDGE